MIWFLSLVFHAMVFKGGDIDWLVKLLGIFWLIYLAGLWLEQSRITDTAWAMLLGYAIGCIRMLDMIPNQQEYAHWLRFIPISIIGVVALASILIFVGVLPLLAKNIVEHLPAHSPS